MTRTPRTDQAGSWYLAEPRGETFRGLLNFALGRVDTLVAVTPADAPLSATCARVLAKLRSAATTSRSRRANSWPGTPHGVLSEVHDFAYAQRVVNVVLAHGATLFEWRLPKLPEDLCLVRAGAPWLITTTHEGDCRVETSQREFAQLLDAVPSLNVITGPGFRGRPERR